MSRSQTLHGEFGVGSNAVRSVYSRQAKHNSASAFCDAGHTRSIYFSCTVQAGIKRQRAIWVSAIRHMYGGFTHTRIIENIHSRYIPDWAWYLHRYIMTPLCAICKKLRAKKSKGCQIQTNAAKNRGILPLLSKMAGVRDST